MLCVQGGTPPHPRDLFAPCPPLIPCPPPTPPPTPHPPCCCKQLRSVDRVRIYGPAPEATPQGRAALATFNVEGIHPTDLSTILDSVSERCSERAGGRARRGAARRRQHGAVTNLAPSGAPPPQLPHPLSF